MIQSDRLDLRPLDRNDLEPWAALLADARATRLLHFPDPHSREQSAELLDRTIGRANGPIAMYTVLVRATDETAGFVGYTPRRLDWGDELELGWMLLTAFHGRGYATEAARALRPLAAGRVVSLIRVENTASQNVARKIGMRPERAVTFAGFATTLWADGRPVTVSDTLGV